MDTSVHTDSSAISVTSDESDATCAIPTNVLSASGARKSGEGTATFEENPFACSDNVSDIGISEENRGSDAEVEAGEAESGED